MARAVRKKELRLEERLEAALVPEGEQPYEVPGNWCWVYLSGIVDLYNGDRGKNYPSKKDYVNEGIPFINAGAIKDGYLDKEEYNFITQDKFDSLRAGKVCRNDILYCLRGSLGKTAIVDFETPAAISSSLCILRNRKQIEVDYLYYLLNSETITRQQMESENGSAQPNLSAASVLKYKIPLPPMMEQQRIVNIIESLFADLDEAKEKLSAVLEGFAQRKAAILHQAFTGELTVKWREEQGISLDSWETKKLVETTIKIIDGDRGSNYPKKNEFTSDGYCIFLSAKNVTKEGFSFDSYECISKEKDELLRNGRLERGDMVMTTRGTIGNVAIYDDSIPFEHLRINSGMVIYRGGDELDKHYLIWLYQSDMIKNQIDKLRTGSAQPQLPIKVMKALRLPIPSLAEQREIVRILDQLFEDEQQAQASVEGVLEDIDTIKKSILARAFRGELGTNEPGEESAMEMLKKML